MSFYGRGLSNDDVVREIILLVTIIACIISAYLVAGKAGIAVLAITPCIMLLGYKGVRTYSDYARSKRITVS
jgi:hypothetical protein